MKHILRVMLFCICLLCAPYAVAHAENGVGISDNKNGTVTVSYDNTSNVKIAVTVLKSGSSTTYTYIMMERTIKTNIPLTSGNGTYKLTVLKNVVDNSYSVLTSEEVQLNLSDSKVAFLTSSAKVDWKTTNNAVKKANSLTKKSKNADDKIKKIYKYVVTNFHYDYDKYAQNASGKLSAYNPDIDSTYALKKGICYDISAMTAAMMRSVGVETQMLTGYPKNKYFNGAQYHAWNKVYTGKVWAVLDVTCDVCLYEQGMKYKKLKMKKKDSEYSKVDYMY